MSLSIPCFGFIFIFIYLAAKFAKFFAKSTIFYSLKLADNKKPICFYHSKFGLDKPKKCVGLNAENEFQ